MTPFYDEDGITIYHGDCREVLPSIDPAEVSLLLTDPPYGMGYKPLRGSDGSKRWIAPVYGDESQFDPRPLLEFERVILFGANWFSALLPTRPGWIVWDKTPLGRKEGFIASDAELAWTSFLTRPHKFAMQWGGEARNHEPHLHPTQKPVALMRWILDSWTNPGGLVLDPYMGSGPIAQACWELGRRYIGIEIDERYCEIAVQRLAQGVLAI